jgi:hypothetical protein
MGTGAVAAPAGGTGYGNTGGTGQGIVGKVENALGGGQGGSQMGPGGTGTGTTGAGGFIQKAKDKLTGNHHQ